MISRTILSLGLLSVVTLAGANGQLFDNLQAFQDRLEVGDPELKAVHGNEGPKSIATADFNGDAQPDIAVSNLDGTVTVLFGKGDDRFSAPLHLQTGASTLRGLVAADFDGDQRPDIATAAPFEGQVFVFMNAGRGAFNAPDILDAWKGVRNLASGDFDGDEQLDLVVAGKPLGLRHYRGNGDGSFEALADFPSLGGGNRNFPKPVYSVASIPSRDGGRDDLLVGHAESQRLWVLGTQRDPQVDEPEFVPGLYQDTETDWPESPLVITEFMAVNTKTLAARDGSYPDWLEIYNRSADPVSLDGWKLTDRENVLNQWTFPNQTLAPGEFLLVMASSKDQADAGGELHTNFKLSGAGEIVALVRPEGEIAHSIPSGTQSAQWTVFDPTTPLMLGRNYVGHERLRDEDGELVNAIEIFNRSSRPSNLHLYHLTGSVPEDRWYLPNMVLNPGDSRLVYLSGKDRRELDGPWHTNFVWTDAVTLRSLFERELQTLTLRQHAHYEPQVADISFGIDSERAEGLYYDLPTPGRPNGAGSPLNEIYLGAVSQVKFVSSEGEPLRVSVSFSEPQRIVIAELYYGTQSPWDSFLSLSRQQDGTYEGVFPDRPEAPEDLLIEVVARSITGSIIPDGRGLIETPLPGAMTLLGSFSAQSARSLAVGSLLGPVAESPIDLVTVNRDEGRLEIHAGNARPERFSSRVSQVLEVPGGPRSVAIVDLDGDGWNDLVVALRNFDRVMTYGNDQGTFVLESEIPAGVSPRELAVADFNRDGQPDTVVINRVSNDVSLLNTFPKSAAIGSLDQIYPTDGEVVGLRVVDMNGDGRDDVVELHRASGDFTVRFSDPEGRLSLPEFYQIGSVPSAFDPVDCNQDGLPDFITANLGRSRLGTISVRLGLPEGGFGPERTFQPPQGSRGLFALSTADFDGDGLLDIAAGYFDCRVAFYRGHGDGTFTHVRNDRFTSESRVMTVGDFDNDGDMDLAGAGYAGDVVVFENGGDLLVETKKRYDYPSPSPSKFGTREITSTDLDKDGDLDLIVGSGRGVIVMIGTEGMGFTVLAETAGGVDYPTSGLTFGDFDGDGTTDLAVSCRILSCISILTQNESKQFVPAITVDVPAGGFLATGDLDGDGHPDMVGSGDVLWTALSSRKAELTAAESEKVSRQKLDQLVINEILAKNNRVPVEQDGGKKSDWVELYNGTKDSMKVNDYRLVMSVPGEAPGETLSQSYAFPGDAVIPPGEHLLVICSNSVRSSYHTGFKLPGSGAKLTLIDRDGELVDEVDYSLQEENVSFGRFEDALNTFAFNPIPNPGRSNADNGAVDPSVDFEGGFDQTLRPNEPIRFSVQGRDDIGVISVSIVYRRLDVVDTDTKRIILFDDGEHGDGGMTDGLFSGLLASGLPSGAEIQYYLEAVDLSGKTITVPGDAGFAAPGDEITVFTLGVLDKLGVEISEVVADNRSGPIDAFGGTPDYIEIRNTSSETVSLKSLSLAQGFFDDPTNVMALPDETLAPGAYAIIFADNNVSQGAWHAPFRIDRGGDQLFLFSTTASGTRVMVDGVETPQLERDQAYLRIGSSGHWIIDEPTPFTGNLETPYFRLGQDISGERQAIFAYPTEAGKRHTVESSDDLDLWNVVDEAIGNGSEGVVEVPLSGQTFFRWKIEQ